MKWSVLLLLPFFASAQRADKTEYVEFVKIMNSDGTIQCVEIPRSEEYIRQWQENAAASGLKVIKETVGRRNAKGELMTGAQAVGLDIVLRGTDQLEANPAAKQAFIVAAQAWETRLLNNVTVVMDVDYGPTRFGTPFSSANVLGSTGSAVISLSGVTMTQYAESLRTRNPGYSDIYTSLPQPLPNTSTTPNPIPSGTLANLQAIGFRSATEVLTFGSAPSIGFNSAFTFDLDPSNGITGGQTDFDAVAVHEMGHALGFVSAIGGTGSARTWDLFRFRPGAVKDTVGFKTAQRVLTPGPSSAGGDQVFWDGTREWEVSTATGSRTGGDGQQASHWRDDAQRTNFPANERKIGIMDPNLASGVRDTLKLPDLKALSLMGWILTAIPIADAPSGFTSQSDYKTPTKITLSWRNPRRFYDGSNLTPFKVVLFRDNQLIKTFDSSKVTQAITYVDSNLTQYQSYTYRIAAIPYAGGDTGNVVTSTNTAGGSPFPAQGTGGSIVSNGSTVVIRATSPRLHSDGTALHNLSKAYLYRNTFIPQNRADSIALSTSDTNTVVTFVDTPPARFNSANSYTLTFLGAANFFAEGAPLAFSAIRSGVINQTLYSEGFEESKASVVANALWDSTNVSARSGTFSIGAMNYPNNANASLYIPQVKGGGTPKLVFWTVCRTEAGKDFGKVEVSKNRGTSWTELLSLDENTHAEWAAGNNMWFKKEIDLSAYATDTILIRFRLTSDGSTSKFGWLLDDIQLQPVALSVGDRTALLPEEYSLGQNFPNPFNPYTRINYALKEQGFVSLKVYDLLGKEVRTIVHTVQDAGYYGVDLNAAELSSGVYFYQLRSGNFTDTKKFVLMK